MSKRDMTIRELPKVKSESVFLHSDEYPIIGNSRAIFRIRNQIDFSADVGYPIFISGEAGTEKDSVAKKIHNRRGLPKGNFINVPSSINDLVAFKLFLKESIEKSKGGTLYFSEIDLLHEPLKDYLITNFISDDFNGLLVKYNIHLIISCTSSLFYKSQEPQFIAKILGCSVPHLEIHIPSLRERKEDVSAHINYILDQICIRHSVSFDQEAMALLLNYHWPENLDQLQHVLGLLVSSCEENITQNDILALNLIKNTHVKSDIVDMIFMGNMEAFKGVHYGLNKALHFMSENFTEELSLTSISNVACTSPSHLSYLFRIHLKQSFKSILVQLRVRYAKKLIENSPLVKITTVSLQSGFGDLSHFEKMFKRHVGCTPRQYRQDLRRKSDVFQVVDIH